MPDTNKQQGIDNPADPGPAPGEVPEETGNDQVGASDAEETQEPKESREPEEPLEPYQIILQGFRTITQTLLAA